MHFVTRYDSEPINFNSPFLSEINNNKKRNKKKKAKKINHFNTFFDITTTSDKDTKASSLQWLPAFHLTEVEKKIILNNDWLDDRIIDVAQMMLRNQYKINGLDTTLLCQTEPGFPSAGYNCLQIHFDEDRNHWFTSSTTNMRVEVSDSLPSGRLSESAIKQLTSRYSELAKDGCIEVYILPCDRQPNAYDCGVYAIANAIEFLEEHGNPTASYDNSQMRTHLLNCLERGKLSLFPKLYTKKRGGKKLTPKLIKIIV